MKIKTEYSTQHAVYEICLSRFLKYKNTRHGA